jgi:hypothetical protein
VLASDIVTRTGNRISASTLKRLFGMAKGIDEPRLYTLDVLAKYLGFKNFDELNSDMIRSVASDYDIIEELKIADLDLNALMTIYYEPNRKLTFKYIGNLQLEIVEVVNSKLKLHDIVIITQVVRNYPLLIKEVIRQNKNLGSYTAAKISGVVSIEVSK